MCALFIIWQPDIFTFDLFDVDSSGVLSLEEVNEMLRDLYGKKHGIHDQKIKMCDNISLYQ